MARGDRSGDGRTRPPEARGTAATARVFARALELHRAGRLDQAAARYREILATAPGHADCIHLLGLIAFQEGRLDEARADVERAIALDGAVALYHANLGRICKAAGRPPDAAAAYRRAVALDPGEAAAHSDLAAVLVELGAAAEAVACCRRALAIDPDLAEAHFNLGLALRGQGAAAVAAASLRRAAALKPSFADAHHQLGLALLEQGGFAEAAASFRRAIAANPGFVEARGNLGNALRADGHLSEAIAAYRETLALAPDRAEVHGNLGVALQELGQWQAAEASYDRALAIDPEDAETHRNRAFLLLLRGRFAEGWAEYEWRWRAHHLAPLRRDFAVPRWDGTALAHPRVLVHAEQGFGDTIQFVRYLPLVAAPGGRVILECQPPLARLLRVVAGADEVIARGEALPAFDAHVALLSLPGLFATTAETIPRQVPYLRADAAAEAAWRRRIPATGRLRVGIAWRGSPQFKGDRLRSPGLAALSPLLAVPGVDFYAVQKGPGREELAALGAGAAVADLAEDFGDFADTAAALAGLDLVIAPDTAVAHLAGALGQAAWVLLPLAPDWRWLLDRDDSPWYPTLRLFRQQRPGDWDDVVRRVGEALRRAAASGAIDERD